MWKNDSTRSVEVQLGDEIFRIISPFSLSLTRYYINLVCIFAVLLKDISSKESADMCRKNYSQLCKYANALDNSAIRAFDFFKQIQYAKNVYTEERYDYEYIN